jgi:hypothetical protein
MVNLKVVVFISLISATFVGASANPSDGYLEIKNYLNSYNESVGMVRDDVNFPATDGYDSGLDVENPQPPSGHPDIRSFVSGYYLSSDFRAEDSNKPYDIRLLFIGGLPSTQENWLEFDMPYDGVEPYGEYHFGNTPITFSSGNLLSGYRIDVRRAINLNSGIVRMDFVPASTSGEYASGQLDIGSAITEDLNTDGIVNFLDYAEFANDWFIKDVQPIVPIKFLSDVNGLYGVPDGVLDMNDFDAIHHSWLMDVNDPNTW